MSGALISAGASLLGGMLSRNAERRGIRQMNEYNDPKNIRKRAEEAGFNPLLFVGPNVGNQTIASQGGQMGQAIADAGMALGSHIDERSEAEKQAQKLQAENDALRSRIGAAARPPIGGVYQGLSPLVPAAVGSSDPAPATLGDASPEEGEMFGPNPAVPVRNIYTGQWTNISPELAAQWELQAGDYLMAAHFEDALGDVMSEAVALPSVAVGAVQGAIGQNNGGAFNGAFSPWIQTPPPAPAQTQAPATPALPFGMSGADLDAMRRRFTEQRSMVPNGRR